MKKDATNATPIVRAVFSRLAGYEAGLAVGWKAERGLTLSDLEGVKLDADSIQGIRDGLRDRYLADAIIKT
jgi:hypothetical protein